MIFENRKILIKNRRMIQKRIDLKKLINEIRLRKHIQISGDES
jgi:hypothetical protein